VPCFNPTKRDGRDTCLVKRDEEEKIVLMPRGKVKLWSSLDNNSNSSLTRKENKRYTSVSLDEEALDDKDFSLDRDEGPRGSLEPTPPQITSAMHPEVKVTEKVLFKEYLSQTELIGGRKKPKEEVRQPISLSKLSLTANRLSRTCKAQPIAAPKSARVTLSKIS
jgi:hypothetical protein